METENRYKYLGGGILSKTRKEDGEMIFYVRVRWKGRRHVEKAGTTLRKAQQVLGQRQTEVDNGTYVPPEQRKAKERASEDRRVTFAEFSKKFLSDYAKGKRSEKWFQWMTDGLVRKFGTLLLEDITQHRVEAYRAERSKKVAPATVNHELRFLKTMLYRALAWGYIKENPVKGVSPLQEPAPAEVFFTPEETGKLIGAAADHLRPVIQTALATGTRMGEVLGLTWDRVSLERRTLYLEKTKNGRARALPISDDLHEILKGLPQGVGKARLFTYNGKPIKSVRTAWLTACERAGLGRRRFHENRHTWASRLVMTGKVGQGALMRLGGWSDAKMVQRYSHLAPGWELDTAQLLNGTLAGIPREAGSPAGSPSIRSIRPRKRNGAEKNDAATA